MSRLTLSQPIGEERAVDELFAAFDRRLAASPAGICPVDITDSFITLSLAQSCGKCVPCRVGLSQMKHLLSDVLDGNGDVKTLALIEKTARVIAASADCAIGFEAANATLTCIKAFHEDFESHANGSGCTASFKKPIPCVSDCPAHVDIPTYVALVAEGRYADAVKVIRKDNPLAAVCGLVCEHPCEDACRRGFVDSALNIRGLKRYAIENAGQVAPPKPGDATDKTVAIVGGGPSGITAAYYLALMGHAVTIFEMREHLGGMLRYGIPAYRLPREILDEEIRTLLSVGVEVKCGVEPIKGASLDALIEQFDAVYLAIGAQLGSSLGIEGQDAEGLMSAVDLLGLYGDADSKDFTGQTVVIVGGGNVAIDAARTSLRSGAKKVIIAYRRRRADMPAQTIEIDSAAEEGIEILELAKPMRVEVSDGAVAGLWVKPQMSAEISGGRPGCIDAFEPEFLIEADHIVAAIGQSIGSIELEGAGVVDIRGRLTANAACDFGDKLQGVFAGGDCVTGPATAIKAIAAGKTAAANIDEYLGFAHTISVDVAIPAPRAGNVFATGRQDMVERPSNERKSDYEEVEVSFTKQKAECEASRCLRCDHFGCGAFRGGRELRW